MKHQTFNGFWHGSQLSPLEWACLSSFIRHGHKFRLFAYDPIAVPEGVSLEDASELIPREELFVADGTVAAFSDLLRYRIILKYGEWWSDADVYCQTDEVPACRYSWADEDADTINGAILKFPSNDPTLRKINEIATSIGRNTSVWCELGPTLLTAHLSKATFDGHFGSRKDFYPIHWLETFLFWLPRQKELVRGRCKDAAFVHLWSSMFDKLGIDRHTKAPHGSFLADIYRPHSARFALRKLDRTAYNNVIKHMEKYFRQEWVTSCSVRKIGYDVSKFPFEDYIQGPLRWCWQSLGP